MSKDLIESIIDDNLVAAKDIFTERMNHILECKLYEEKRRIAAILSEIMGGKLSAADIQARKEAGYMKASDYFEIMDKLKTMQTKAEKQKAAKQGAPTTSRKKKLEEVTEKEKAAISRAGEGPAMRIAKQFGRTAAAMKSAETEVPASQGTVDQEKPQTQARPRKAAPAAKAPETPSVERPAMDMSKMRREKPGMDVSKMNRAASERTGPIRKVSIPKSDRMERIKQSAERLKARGHSDPLGKLTALKTKRFLRTLGTGLKAVKRGAEEIGRTGGSI